MNNRSHHRHVIDIEALLHFHDAGIPPAACSVVDLSVGGARVVSSRKLDRESISGIQIGSFGTFGTAVIWISNAGIGLKFTEPADVMAEVVMAVAMYG